MTYTKQLDKILELLGVSDTPDNLISCKLDCIITAKGGTPTSNNLISSKLRYIAELLDGSTDATLYSEMIADIIEILGGECDSKLISKQLDVIIELLQNQDPYTPVEYIESTGTQYINTGYFAKRSTKVEIKLLNVDTGSRYILGARNLFRTYDYSLTYDYNYAFIYGKMNQDTYIYTEVHKRDEPDILISEINEDGGFLIINGDSFNCEIYPDDYTGNYSIYIFATNNGGEAYKPIAMKLYYMKIWDGGTLVFDLIPVLDENNVACLYNKVTNTYLYNAGTGSFIAGDPIND